MLERRIKNIKREIDYLSKVYSPNLKKVKLLKEKLSILQKEHK